MDNPAVLTLLLMIAVLLLFVLFLVLHLTYKTKNYPKLKWPAKTNQVEPNVNFPPDLEQGKELWLLQNGIYNTPYLTAENCSFRTGLGTYRHVAIQLLENLLHNLYNVKVKLECKEKPFKSTRELPLVCATSQEICKQDLLIRLDAAVNKTQPQYKVFEKLIDGILNATSVTSLHNDVAEMMKQAETLANKSGLERELLGTLPRGGQGYFTTSAINCSELIIEWNTREISGTTIIEAAQKLNQLLRNEGRQPTYNEYLCLQFAYFQMMKQNVSTDLQQGARFLGTPGFRKDTQSYMSLTDPGDGHVMGTTKKSDWMKGAIIHVEHLERPNHDPRSKIESYRIPSHSDFCKVRLHVGDIAPTTSFMGRRVKDSDDGDFERDFVKTVHLTSAACTAMFQNGAAECKIAMEGLTTSQAVKYMQALRGQTIRSHKQILSAAWNLNQTIMDDFQRKEAQILNTRTSIARRAIDITCMGGGFEKITWDGASDTYPSQCIMYQLTEEEALSIVHEAHERGLVTYFSSGFKFAEIQLAIFSGVDGVGIGGAQVLRFMDKESGMHGPYMEENITRILTARDEAAASVRGQGVHLLCRLDTMYFEGSITAEENTARLGLFEALSKKDEHTITAHLNAQKHIIEMSDDGEMPMVGTAKRLLQSHGQPFLKLSCDNDVQWNSFLGRLRYHVLQSDEDAVLEEYISSLWSAIREKYHREVCKFTARQSHALLKIKHFK